MEFGNCGIWDLGIGGQSLAPCPIMGHISDIGKRDVTVLKSANKKKSY